MYQQTQRSDSAYVASELPQETQPGFPGFGKPASFDRIADNSAVCHLTVIVNSTFHNDHVSREEIAF